jgi:hypothetical protein
MVPENLHALVRANTMRVTIDGQCGTLTVVKASLVEKGRPMCLKLSHNSEAITTTFFCKVRGLIKAGLFTLST